MLEAISKEGLGLGERAGCDDVVKCIDITYTGCA